MCVWCVQVVGEALRDCISLEPCEWLVARALDALYDVFGADECPVQLFLSLQIMPVLESAASQVSARVGHVAGAYIALLSICCSLLYYIVHITTMCIHCVVVMCH